jgi:hypothetical protein
VQSDAAPKVEQPATTPELLESKTADGKTVRVNKADFEAGKTRLRTYTKDGETKPGPAIHRDNLDVDGSKKSANAEEAAKNPLFDVIGKKDGMPFKNKMAAVRELKQRGLSETHEVSEVDGGFVGRRKAEATPAAPIAAPQPANPKRNAELVELRRRLSVLRSIRKCLG